MRNKLLTFLLCALLPVASFAQSPAVKSDHPDRYTVVKGDTLWDISARFLREPWRWPEIWEVNPQIGNPHLIYPGDVVYLTYRDGKPVLSVNRDGGGDTRTVKLSPQVRSSDGDGAIPSIPIEYIRPFLSQQRVVSENEMDDWPYVVSSYDQRLIAGTGNKIYVRGLDEGETATDYTIYRQGPAYVLPSDADDYDRAPVVQSKYNNREVEGEVLGYQALYVGEAEVVRGGDPASAIITDSEREIRVGDRLVPQTQQSGFSGDFIPSEPDESIDGRIVSVIDGVSEIGNYQVVVISAGANEGLESGNVLAVYQSGEVVRDTVPARTASRKNPYLEYFGAPKTRGERVVLPEEFAGIIVVFRTFEKVSYALVMDTERPIHIYDTVTNP